MSLPNRDWDIIHASVYRRIGGLLRCADCGEVHLLTVEAADVAA